MRVIRYDGKNPKKRGGGLKKEKREREKGKEYIERNNS